VWERGEGQDISQGSIYHERYGQERYSEQWNNEYYRLSLLSIIRHEELISHRRKGGSSCCGVGAGMAI
jgi:hypothetical protein